jgi:hypothetical protein
MVKVEVEEVGDVVKETRQAQPPAVKNYSIETPRRMFTPNYRRTKKSRGFPQQQQTAQEQAPVQCPA